MKRLFLFLIIIFVFSCAQEKEVVKYRNFYNFEGFLKLKTLTFQPFPQNISFKTKNKLVVDKRKYTFYSIVYSYKDYCRIFSYALFGKKIGDIFIEGKKIYIVPGKEKIVYIAYLNNENVNKSLFNFFKDVIKGINLDKAFTDGDCYKGFYYSFLASTCRKDNFRTLQLTKKNFYRSVCIIEAKNNFPIKILIDFQKKKLLIEVKKILTPKIDPKKSFFDYTKNFKKYYAKDLIELENIMLMGKNNENKKNSKRN